MMDPTNIPPVTPDETVARYILQRSHIRSSDGTIKPDAFIPHPHNDLSVTRHLSATENELWYVGENVAKARGKNLYGRGDVLASVFSAQRLAVTAAPVANNPNHANICHWPVEKSAQKIIAQEISVAAGRAIIR